jgi:agmatine deiminase
MKTTLIAMLLACGLSSTTIAQSTHRLPDEVEPHEGTWLTWPHHYTYGTAYRNSLDATWVAMTKALVAGERVHIIAYNATERTRITNLLTAASVSLTKVDFLLRQSDDVWVRDNGPIFVFAEDGTLKITDWGFDGWGDDTPFAKDNTIPAGVATHLNLPRVDLGSIVLEGGAIEHDGHGTMIACRSSTLDTARNPTLTQTAFETALRTHFGFTKFIWLDGAYGGEEDITDLHIDGFLRFAPGRKLITMSNADLADWGVSAADITRINNATDASGTAYQLLRLPLTAANVRTTDNRDLGYKGSYANYYVGNTVVLVPSYNDANDAAARALLAPLYPGRTMVGIDVRNLYENGGMVHCVTQQQPAVPKKLKGTRAGTQLSLQFDGDPLHTYRLESSTTLAQGSWADQETFTLAGQTKLFTVAMTGNRKFFRVTE